MKPVEDFSDEELTAFLDGVADAALTARIAADQTPELHARLEGLRRGGDLARELFATALDLAPNFPARDLPGARSYYPRRTFAVGALTGAMAAALAGLLIWGGAWFSGAGRVEPWHREAAAYHALYVPATLAKAADAETRAASLKDLSAVVGRDLTGLPDVAELNFRRAQNLGFEGHPLIQIAFLGSGDAPIALCILRQAGETRALESAEISGMAAAYWADGSHRFLLIGGHDQGRIDAAAAVFSNNL